MRESVGTFEKKPTLDIEVANTIFFYAKKISDTFLLRKHRYLCYYWYYDDGL